MNQWETEFLRQLVELDTNSIEKVNYPQCAEVLMDYCKDVGLEVEVFDSEGGGISQPNIVATMDAGAEQTVLLCTHYDVVPAGDLDEWTRDPFTLTIEKDKAYGRGVSDDKGNVVAAVSVAKELVEKGTSKVNLKILVSPNEEVGGEFGIDYIINGPPKIRGDFAVVVDSGPEFVSIGASGVVAGAITIKGKQGHVGYPFMFRNAIHLSLPFLEEIMRFSDRRQNVESMVPAPPGSPHRNLWGRFSITMYHAGTKTNIIPGKAEIHFDLRLIPEESADEIIAEFRRFFELVKEETFVDASLEIEHQIDGWCTDPQHFLVTAFHDAAKAVVSPDITLCGELGGNDGTYFSKVGIPTVCYGVIARDCNFHGVDEFMRLADFDKVKNLLIRFAERSA